MKPGLSEIVVVLDQSGSMQGIKSDVIGQFNGFLEEQRKVPGEARFSLVLFDSRYYTERYIGEDINKVEPLNDSTYRPGASTPLLDAIGKTIISVGQKLAATPEGERPSKVIFVIMTDGLENASREFTEKGKIKEMVEHQTQKYSWEFIFLGANMDAIAEGGSLGVAQSFSYAANAQGVQQVYANVSRMVTASRLRS